MPAARLTALSYPFCRKNELLSSSGAFSFSRMILGRPKRTLMSFFWFEGSTVKTLMRVTHLLSLEIIGIDRLLHLFRGRVLIIDLTS
jgi:hypothetical protein